MITQSLDMIIMHSKWSEGCGKYRYKRDIKCHWMLCDLWRIDGNCRIFKCDKKHNNQRWSVELFLYQHYVYGVSSNVHRLLYQSLYKRKIGFLLAALCMSMLNSTFAVFSNEVNASMQAIINAVLLVVF